MSRMSTCLYGDLADVDAILEDHCDEAEIRAALQNVIRSIIALEKKAEAQEKP